MCACAYTWELLACSRIRRSPSVSWCRKCELWVCITWTPLERDIGSLGRACCTCARAGISFFRQSSNSISKCKAKVQAPNHQWTAAGESEKTVTCQRHRHHSCSPSCTPCALGLWGLDQTQKASLVSHMAYCWAFGPQVPKIHGPRPPTHP